AGRGRRTGAPTTPAALSPAMPRASSAVESEPASATWPRTKPSGSAPPRTRPLRTAADSRAGKSRAQLRSRDVTPLAGLERTQLEPAEAHPLQCRDLVVDRLEQPPHFPVPAAAQRHGPVRLPCPPLPNPH